MTHMNKNNHCYTTKRKWEMIQKMRLPNMDRELAKRYGAERITWYKFRGFLKELSTIYESSGYKSYAITIKRGKKNADLAAMRKALDIAIKDLNRHLYKNTLPGIEIPYFTFEGNSIDGGYNPHLHVAIWIPKGKAIFVRTFVEDSILNTFATLRRRFVTDRERYDLHVWMKKLKGDLNNYIGYCARKEDEAKGQNFDKIIWELCSFGFKSGENDKRSRRIERRIYQTYPSAQLDSCYRHKVFVMLHWILQRKNPKAMLRIYLPTLTTDSTKVERPLRTLPMREMLIKDFEKKYDLKFDRCYFVLRKRNAFRGA